MTVIGIIGAAGSGKSALAEAIAPAHLVKKEGSWRAVNADGPRPVALRPHALTIGLADPIKVAVQDFYDFSDAQLWGPSEYRNAPDPRFPRPCGECKGAGYFILPRENGTATDIPCSRCSGTKVDYLTPREALQRLGSEYGRALYEDTWIELALVRARELLGAQRIEKPTDAHTFLASWVVKKCDLITIPDVRFLNEVRRIREAGGQVWKIERPGLDTSAAMYRHVSETEQRIEAAAIDKLVTATLQNDGTLDDLRNRAAAELAIAKL